FYNIYDSVGAAGGYQFSQKTGASTYSDLMSILATGDVHIKSNLLIGNGASTGDTTMEVGQNRTGNGNAYIDLHSSSGSDYDARIIKNTGVNGSLDIFNLGTGNMNLNQTGAGNLTFNVNGAERMRIDSTGRVGIGTASPTYELDMIKSASNGYLTHRIYNTATGGSTGASIQVATGTAGAYLAFTNTENAGTPYSIFGSGSGNSGGLYIDVAHATAPMVFRSGGSVEKMRLTSAGNVGIGTASPSQKLEVNGSVLATAYLYSSDRRLKTDIQSLESPLEKILSLQGVTYHWKTPLNPTEQSRQLGVIAQDVREVYPEAVQEDNKGLLKVNYPALVAPVIEAIKELFNRFQVQENRVEELEAKVQTLERQNQALEERLKRIELNQSRAPAGE
ncbi:MAG: tail fiber domain-containing protein, partial [Pseudobdellovibrionaceae bacterium]